MQIRTLLLQNIFEKQRENRRVKKLGGFNSANHLNKKALLWQSSAHSK